jgi:hypothetical protein
VSKSFIIIPHLITKNNIPNFIDTTGFRCVLNRWFFGTGFLWAEIIPFFFPRRGTGFLFGSIQRYTPFFGGGFLISNWANLKSMKFSLKKESTYCKQI